MGGRAPRPTLPVDVRRIRRLEGREPARPPARAPSAGAPRAHPPRGDRAAVLAELDELGRIKHADVQAVLGVGEARRRILGALRERGVIEVGSEAMIGRSVSCVRASASRSSSSAISQKISGASYVKYSVK